MNAQHVTLRQDTEGIELGKGQEDGEGDENECNQEVESLFQNGHTSSWSPIYSFNFFFCSNVDFQLILDTPKHTVVDP